MAILRAAVLAVATLLAGCTSNEYQPYEARDPFREGQGGTRRTVGGIDIWQNGTPPRRYQIIGVLTVTLGEGIGHRALVENSVVQQTRRRNGDGAILVGSDSDVTGAVAQPIGAGAVLIPVRSRVNRFLIIKYAD